MEYGKSILPTDSAGYTLVNASMVAGRLTMLKDGYLKYVFRESDIANLTQYFRVSLIPDRFTNNYLPKIRAHVHIETVDGNFYNNTLFLTECTSGVYLQELEVQSGEYKNFTFEIFSEEEVSFLLWELCPEAADDDIQTVIDGVEQSLPRLLYDYNSWPIMIEQPEQTISLITCRLLDATDLQGHFHMTYVASDPCVLTLRFKDNEATELFAPVTYDLRAGRGSIGIPHAYLDRLAGLHNILVTAQISTGTLIVDTRGILFTIDGGYLAERLIDVGSDVYDISIRQLSQDYGPDEIWIVGIDAGEALVRNRPYQTKAAVSFEPQFSVGHAIAAAIEFDGDWCLRPNDETYTLETEEQPWVFWIDPDLNLYAQHGPDETTKVLLDTEVSSLYACRGYKSSIYPEYDQGIVIVYVKAGRVYYKQYAYDITSQCVRWLDACVLDDTITDAKSVSVQRLNDYRLGIIVVLSEKTELYITERTYVNQAVPKETIKLNAPKSILLAYYPSDYDITLQVLDQGITDDHLHLWLCVNKLLYIEGEQVTKVITFNENSIPADSIEDITLTQDETTETTVIDVYLNTPTKALLTYIYLNKMCSHQFVIKIPNWGYIRCPELTVEYDTTNYIIMDPITKSTIQLPIPTKAEVTLRSIGVITPRVTEVITLPTPIGTISYSAGNVMPATTQENIILPSPFIEFAYVDTRITPI